MGKRWIVLVALIGLMSAPARAAGPYDGKWSGSASAHSSGGTASGACEATLTATVADNKVKAAFVSPRGNPTPFQGTVDASGVFTSEGGRVTGKFNGNSFEGVSPGTGNCLDWRLSMKRS